MPIKKDGTGKRWVEMELVVPGTPEQVWQAIATGPGNTAWFTKTTIDERVGGEIRFDLGPHGESVGEVVAWDAPRRLEYVEHNWLEGAPPVATEVTVTGRTGNQCVVRMVHSLFSSTDDWDDQLEGFEKGWPVFFEVLRIYLGHFAGRQAACFMAMTKAEGRQLEAWKRLTQELGLAGAHVGEESTTPSEPQRLSGVIERVQEQQRDRTIVIRLATPCAGVAIVGTSGADPQVNASVVLYFYGDDAETLAAASEPRWQRWLDGLLATSQAS